MVIFKHIVTLFRSFIQMGVTLQERTLKPTFKYEYGPVAESSQSIHGRLTAQVNTGKDSYTRTAWITHNSCSLNRSNDALGSICLDHNGFKLYFYLVTCHY